jgi:hypothetical protein
MKSNVIWGVAFSTIMVLLALIVSTQASASSSSTGSAYCSSYINYGYGFRATMVATGNPAWAVRAFCFGVRSVPHWHRGVAPRANKLVCGAWMRAHPNVTAGIFTTPTAAPLMKSYCKVLFPNRSWHRF